MTHLIIIQGHDRGREVSVPATGLRVGRSHANDIAFPDEEASQFHCRFFFKSDGALCVTDFASTNGTLVNGQPVTEARLQPGDTVFIGAQMLRVVHASLQGAPGKLLSDEQDTDDARPESAMLDPAAWEEGNEEAEPVPPPPPPPAPSAPKESPASAASSVDLGFGSPPGGAARSEGPVRIQRLVWWGVTVLLLIGLTLVALYYADYDRVPDPVAGEVGVPSLAILYEKVEGSPENIFRYALQIEDQQIHIQIDDIKNNRHVAREKDLDSAVVRRLKDSLRATEFTELRPDYAGVSGDVYNLSDLTIVFGKRAHRVRVLNRVEPDRFRRARELIEEFGRAELGLAALAMSPERLQEMAREAYLEGRKRFEGREVRYGNLAESIRQFTLTLWYLETIEPKPDIYQAALQERERAERELDEQYQNHIFRAERSIKLRDWEEAARSLRIVLELIPDRADERHQEAERRLLTVERYL